MRKILFLIAVVFWGVGAFAQSDQYQKRLALVIGNSNYKAGMELKNPGNDARAMGQTLQSLGFDVLQHENLTLEGLKKAILEFGKRLKGYDVGLFYYAGHGIQHHGHNYIIPVEVDLESEDHVEIGCLRAEQVVTLMDMASAKVNLVILDACRNNPFERRWNRSANGSGLAVMEATRGTLIAYATAPGSTASDGAGENGLYTSAILKHIRDESLTIEQVFKRVRTEVEEKSNNRQHPWESTSLSGEDLYVARGFNVRRTGKLTSNAPTLSASDLKQAEQLYLSGVQKFNSRMYNDALYDLTQSLELNPYSAETQYSMGRLHFELKLSDQALSDFNRTIALKPEMSIAYVSRGMLYYTRRNYQDAADDFEVASTLVPQSPDYRYNWGLALYELGAYEKAIAAFTQSLDLNPSHLNSRYYRGMSLHSIGRMKAAVNDFDKVLSVQPGHAKALLYRALSLTQVDATRALKALDSVIMQDPEQPIAYCERGIIHLKNHNLELSANDLNEAIKKDNNLTKAIFWKGRWFYEAQNPKEALFAFEACIRLDSAHAEAIAWRGYVQAFPTPPFDLFIKEADDKSSKRERELKEAAARDLDLALRLEPDNAELLLLRAGFLIRSGDLKRAADDLAKVLSQDPENQDALILTGRIKYESGDFGGASIHLTKSIRVAKSPEAYFWRGECGVKLKILEQAASDFENSLELNPLFSKAFFRLMETAVLLKDYDKALKGYSRALEEGKIDKDEIQLHRAESQLKMGDPSSALEGIKTLFPDDYLNNWVKTVSKNRGRNLYVSDRASVQMDGQYFQRHTRALWLMAQAYYSQGQKKPALDAVYILLHLDPENEDYKKMMAQIRQMRP